MTQGTPQELSGSDFAQAWDTHHEDLLAWLKKEWSFAQPSEIDAAFSAAAVEVRKDDWQACRDLFQHKKDTKKAALEYLKAVFRRAVRAVEVKLWSRRILGQDRIPSGPLTLLDTWRHRLPAPWNSSDPKIATMLQAELGELAKGGWGALGAYGKDSDPGEYFLQQLQHLLKWHKTYGSWEAVLHQAKATDGRRLLEVFEQQALNEFNDPADGDRAFHWAIDYLVKKKFTSSNILPVHEASNPSGYLSTAFALALVDFRRGAWRLGQIQRPRPDIWMQRSLDRDWLDIFGLAIKHANIERAVQGFLSGEHHKVENDDPTDDDHTSQNADAQQGASRMSDVQRRFQALAQQIETDHKGDPTARIRAIAVWSHSYLRQVKNWSHVVSDLSLTITDSEGEETERPMPSGEGNPLTSLLHVEDCSRLEQAERIAKEYSHIEDRLRAVNRYLFGPDFELTSNEKENLRWLADRPAPKKGRPPTIPPLNRLNQALKDSGWDISIMDYVSVIFTNWNDDKPQDHPDTQSGRRPPDPAAGSGDTP